MAEEPAKAAALDVVHPSGERTRIPIDPLPFRIGRGPDNNLILRDNRASRTHAQISLRDSTFVIEDLESLHGTWVNGERIPQPTALRDGDRVHFGIEDSYRLTFSDSGGRIGRIFERLSAVSAQPGGASGKLARLRAVVDVARTLQTTLANDEVLAAVLDAALAVTRAERGFLLLRRGEELEVKIGRDVRGAVLTARDLNVPTNLIDDALRKRHDLLFMALDPQLRNVIAVPLVQFRRVNAEETVALSSRTSTVGLLYLESRESETSLSELNRELLHTLALEVSTILENAALLEEERQQRLLEQELGFARQVQQGLLPQKFPDSEWFSAAGSSTPSAEVAGDYFDVHAVGETCVVAVIADVSGKGVGAALLASLLQGAFLLGSGVDLPLESLMSTVNRFLIDRAQREKYATVFYAKIERAGSATWVNAGHSPPILIRSNGQTEKLDSTSTPLGLLRTPKIGTNQTQLTRGDKLVIYSDGLVEAENSSGETFDTKLSELVGELTALNPQEMHSRITEEAARFRGDRPLADDVTVLVLEYRG